MRMRLSHAFCKWMFPLAVRRADVLACVSNSTRQSLNDVFPGSIHRSIVIRSGIEPSYMTTLDDTTRDLVLAKHRPPKRYLYYTGPIRDSKNVPNMLMAFAALRSQDGNYSNLNFLIDSPPSRELEDIRRLVKAMRIHEVVRLYDSIADSERRVFYDRSEALCFVCKNEGFGFPVLEAQATGTPVLAADSGALPEVAGPGALLVDPDRVDSIMEGMRRIISDAELRADLVRTGNRNVKNFSWKKTAEQTRDLYNAVL
jgi:glycosyltransferase involved in cell wall biosynthesis